MHIFHNLNSVQLAGPTVLTIGTFDGLHRGHQTLIAQLKQAAQARQAQTAVIAFHPRPKTVLAPHLPNNDYLTTRSERIALFEQLAPDYLILTPFTLELAQTTAPNFVKLLVNRLKMVELWAGHDFALGKNREGNIETLRALGKKFGYTVHEFAPLVVDGIIVSSTGIRRLLLAGQVRQAGHLLGRYPSVSGQITRGQQRGRTIGFPTTNLAAPPERLIPANGVYATFVRFAGDERRYAGVTNVGLRPSFAGNNRTIETFIFDFDEDVYGRMLTLEFVERLRGEQKFNTIEELKGQITLDAAQARDILAREPSEAEAY